MHPAFSVILFTTLSGAGYGLLALLAASLLVAPDGGASLQFPVTMVLALILIVVGLLSSTLHLGHPERAWMAFSQWRSSWLSREGVFAVVTFLPALVIAAALLFGTDRIAAGPQILSAAAVATIVLVIATVFSTAMIYCSIRAVSAWHNRWVPINYLVLALMSGIAWFNAIAAVFGNLQTHLVYLGSAVIAVAGLLKNHYWRTIDANDGPSDRQSALGLKAGQHATLFIRPHSEDNYLLKEMGFRIARKHAERLRRFSLALAFGVPLVFGLLASSMPGPLSAILAGVAVAGMMAGLLIERWLFFAEAKHAVSLYYGDAPS